MTNIEQFKKYKQANNKLRWLCSYDKNIIEAMNWNTKNSYFNKKRSAEGRYSYFNCDRVDYLKYSKGYEARLVNGFCLLRTPDTNLMVVDVDIKCEQDIPLANKWIEDNLGELANSSNTQTRTDGLGYHIFLKVDYQDIYREAVKPHFGNGSGVDIFYHKSQIVQMGGKYINSYIRLWEVPFVSNDHLLDKGIIKPNTSIDTRDIVKVNVDLTDTLEGDLGVLQTLITSTVDLNDKSYSNYVNLVNWCKCYEYATGDIVYQDIFDWFGYDGNGKYSVCDWNRIGKTFNIDYAGNRINKIKSELRLNNNY